MATNCDGRPKLCCSGKPAICAGGTPLIECPSVCGHRLFPSRNYPQQITFLVEPAQYEFNVDCSAPDITPEVCDQLRQEFDASQAAADRQAGSFLLDLVESEINVSTIGFPHYVPYCFYEGTFLVDRLVLGPPEDGSPQIIVPVPMHIRVDFARDPDPGGPLREEQMHVFGFEIRPGDDEHFQHSAIFLFTGTHTDFIVPVYDEDLIQVGFEDHRLRDGEGTGKITMPLFSSTLRQDGSSFGCLTDLWHCTQGQLISVILP